MRKKTISLVALLLVLITAALSANGVSEISSDDTVIRVIQVELEDGGVYKYTAQRMDGSLVIYRASEEQTTHSVPFDQVHEGSVLAVKDSGIMTMSIPPQMWAVEIRDITLAYNLGAYDDEVSFAPVQDLGMITSPDTQTTLWDITLSDDLTERFSYAYAYDTISSYVQQGLVFRGSYFARGTLDFWNGATELLIPIEEMANHVDEYVNTVYTPGEAETTGDAPHSIDEIMAITECHDLSERFSYAYGFVNAFQDYYYGLSIDGESYVEGALTAIYGLEPLLTGEERAQVSLDYVEMLSQQYEEALAQLAADNLARAEAFLEENATAEGIVTTESGLQYEVISQGDGATPAAEDTVNVNYTLRDIDGNLIESNDNIEFSLQGLIPGFTEAVQQIQTGGEVIAYIHPSLGYGEDGAGSIGPNSLLVFDITLNGIVDTAAEAEATTATAE